MSTTTERHGARALAALAGVAIAAACSLPGCADSTRGGGGGGQNVTQVQTVTFEGQRLDTQGPPVTVARGLMVPVGKSVEGKQLYAVSGGGGGGTGEVSRPFYLQVGPDRYQLLSPEPNAALQPPNEPVP